jgi:hypothetical protein
MCDGKNEQAFRVNFERDQVRELIENGLPNRNRSGLSAWPYGVKSRSLFETPQNFIDSIDEPVTPARTPLFIPERRRADFCPRVRVKIDAHDGG